MKQGENTMKKKCIIYYNKDKKNAVFYYEKIKSFLDEEKIEILSNFEVEKADFAIVIGGDGTLLQATQTIIKNKNIVVIAINAGTLGFLTEIKPEESIEACKSYLNNEYKIDERGLIDITINEEKKSALNEIVFSNGGMAKKPVKISIHTDRGRINCYKGDGVIVSTPTGSTAYSLSAGGPIISPYIDAILITPIAPHNLTTRPIVIDPKLPLTIDVEEEIDSDKKSIVVIDGIFWEEITKRDKITIQYSDIRLKLLSPKKRNYYSVLKQKLKWGENLC